MNLQQFFSDTLRRHGFFKPGDPVFVACSGGPDSVALFYLLYGLKDSFKIRLGLLHFHHQLRGREADRDQLFVQKLARRFRVPFYGGTAPVLQQSKKNRESVEEAARKARYDFFSKIGKKFRHAKIALAHTLDDQAETVLMRILQGTGSRGLLGIRRSMRYGHAELIRPLLDFSKQDLLKFLKQHKITFCRDRSNQSMKFLRNKIRKKLLPGLAREFNPRIVQALARIPFILQEENDLLEALEQKAYKTLFRQTGSGRARLARKPFLRLSGALQFRVLHRALQQLDVRSGLDFEAWNFIKPSLKRKHFTHSLPKNIDFKLTPAAIVLYKK